MNCKKTLLFLAIKALLISIALAFIFDENCCAEAGKKMKNEK
jgi:hypothetical protein